MAIGEPRIGDSLTWDEVHASGDCTFVQMNQWQQKFDALIAAVFELDDDTRDRVLARAKSLEAESVDE